MNPTINKKDFEDLTSNLKDFAYSYIEKYNPSKQQLKIFLLKKYLKKYRGSKIKKEVTQIIDEILIGLENNKLINDEIYSDSKARSLLRKGYSINKINSSLRAKGVSENFIKDTIKKIKEKNIETDFISAIRLCKRRRIGPLRPDANRELFYKKDMGILARSGFDFETSKKILKMDNSEFKKYLKLI